MTMSNEKIAQLRRDLKATRAVVDAARATVRVLCSTCDVTDLENCGVDTCEWYAIRQALADYDKEVKG